MAGLTLDAGALIAADRLDRGFWIFWKVAMRRGVSVAVPASVLAQVWRGSGNANMARVLRGCYVEPLNGALARRAGELCRTSATADSIDAAVVVSAARRGDDILTTDASDLRLLVSHVTGAGTVIDMARLP